MNKQELIDKLKKLLTKSTNDFDNGHDYGIRKAVLLAEDLDEPERPPEPKPLELEKPVVPQFVADWYEKNKNCLEWNLYTICLGFYKRELQDDLHNWFKYEGNKPIETLVKMKLFGYEVEKEKLYTVEIPNPNGDGYRRVYLGRNEYNKIKLHVWDCFPSIEFSNDWKQLDITQLTEAEIKEDFEWAWKFAKKVEE